MNTRPIHLALALALLCSVALSGCEDRAARERQQAEARLQEEQAQQRQAEHARQQALLAQQMAELQLLQTEHQQAAQDVQARSEQLAELRQAHDETASRHSRLQEAVQAYMGRNRMAVAALAAGALGGSLALSEDSEVSQGARELGAAVGIAALAYAAFNLEEVTRVARDLMEADEQLQTLARDQAALGEQAQQAADALQQAQERQQQAAQRVLQLRAAMTAE
jgi:hypothetical protein